MEREPEILWFILGAPYPHKPEEALVPVEVIGGLDAVLPLVETPSVNVVRSQETAEPKRGTHRTLLLRHRRHIPSGKGSYGSRYMDVLASERRDQP